ncbi:MAG: hypothetical protein RLZZ200_2815 [Pseudomonadota bacterium]
MKYGIARFIDPADLMAALYAFAVAMALGLVLLFVALVIQKIIVERHRRLEEAAFERLVTHFESGNAQNAPDLAPEQAVERRALSRALARLNRRGKTEPMTSDAARDGLIRHLQRDTRHSHWGRRTAALEALGRLQSDSLLPFFMEFAAQEQDRRVFAAALTAAARIVRSTNDLRDLASLLVSKPALSRSFNESVLFLAFDTLSQDAQGAQPVIDFISTLPPGHELLGDSIAAAARCGQRGILPLLERICTDPATNLTLRLTAIRAIGRLQPDHPLLESALRDASWEARAVAAGHLHSAREGALEGLRISLRDPNFHVRRNAADSLLRLGEPGVVVLKDMLDSDDRFARDASRTALGQKEQGHG